MNAGTEAAEQVVRMSLNGVEIAAELTGKELSIFSIKDRDMEKFTEEAFSLAVYFNVSTDYLLMGRDYVNLHSRKRLEGVLQELSGIIADLQDV